MGMEQWSLDIINSYCAKLLDGRFECELTKDKGRIMIAKCSVRQGELLFTEPPLHVVCEDAKNEAFKMVQKLCTEHESLFDYEPLWYWTALCSLTEEQCQPPPRIGSLKTVSLEQQQRLLCLYHEPVTEASEAVQKLVEALGLSVDACLVEELLHVWILNCFEHSEDPLGYSAYFASSFVSHSCFPNSIWCEGDDDAHLLRARRDIAPGEEITISYLEEHVLLHAAEERKRSLLTTKLFTCTCERCSPSSAAGGNADQCRGFRCQNCGNCGVFHPLVYDAGKGGLHLVACTNCGSKVSETESKRLLKMEHNLKIMLDEVEGLGGKAKSREKDLLRYISDDKERGGIGPQHWLYDRVWENLEKLYTLLGRHEEARAALSHRITYQRKAYTDPNGTLAWTLEAQATLLLQHLGLRSSAGMRSSTTPAPPLDSQTRADIKAQIMPALEEACQILKLMFGNRHEYYSAVVERRNHAREQLASH
eukprot:TRINITY_DN14855_c0_g1_i1.p1 TRINITY_DN14855_c0_g1~~TRINITY_DN14855_c0_g1_i1.p1  ORF type:complete len:479 (+),score=81.52 TRINITY_DN14855_c0_g1_i1:65-1501(+)